MALDLLQRAIPGQSLTSQPGSTPMEMPPQFADMNGALNNIWDKLTDPRQATRLLIILKRGVPVEYIAKAILFSGFGQGKWTPDVALMSLKVVMAMIISIAAQKGVKVKIFNPDKEQDEFLGKFADSAEEPTPDEMPVDKTKLPVFTGLLGGNI